MRNAPLGELGVRVLDCEHKTPKAAAAGHPYIAIPDVKDGSVDLRSARRISDADFKEWTRRHRPQAGDVIVTRRARVGDTGVVPDVPCAIGQNLVLLRSQGDKILQDFLRWACRSPLWHQEVDRHANVGAVFSSLNVREIPLLRVPAPPLDEQRAIADLLCALDDKIAANSTVIAQCLELGGCIAQNSTSEEKRLEEIAAVTMGTSPRGEQLNHDGAGIPFFQGVRDFGAVCPQPRVFTDSPVRTADEGSTLFAVRAPVGKVNLAPARVAIGRGVASLRSAAAPATLHFALRAQQDAWKIFEGDGTVFTSVNAKELKSMPISYPENHGEVESRVAPLLHQAIQAQKENTTLAATRDELLPLLMSGKITVKDAEKRVEEEV